MTFSSPYSTFTGCKWDMLFKSETAGYGRFKGKEKVGVILTQVAITCIDIWGILILQAALQ